jgi:hypothetical protein
MLAGDVGCIVADEPTTGLDTFQVRLHGVEVPGQGGGMA